MSNEPEKVKPDAARTRKTVLTVLAAVAVGLALTLVVCLAAAFFMFWACESSLSNL